MYHKLCGTQQSSVEHRAESVTATGYELSEVVMLQSTCRGFSSAVDPMTWDCFVEPLLWVVYNAQSLETLTNVASDDGIDC